MECIWEGVFENIMNYRHEGNDSAIINTKKYKTLKSVVSNISRLFHHKEEALFPKSCTEVKAERRFFFPKVKQSLDCATGNQILCFLFNELL